MTNTKKRARSAAVAPDAAGDTDTESKILAAARTVFTRSGTAGARMQDIAREAGVNQALLHYYFRSKQQLADRVFEDAATTLFSAMPKVLPQHASLEEMIRGFVHTYIETMRRTPFLPAYIAGEAHHDPARFVAIIAKVTGADPQQDWQLVLRRFQALIDAQAAAGAMRPMLAEHLIVNIVAMVAFPFVARGVLIGVHGMDGAAYERFLDERREELPRFILNAIRP